MAFMSSQAVPCPRIPGLRQNREVVFYAEDQHAGKGNH